MNESIQEHLIQVPHIAQSILAPRELSRVLWPEVPAAFSASLVGDNYSPLSQELFDIAQAEAEPLIQPYAISDDLRRKAVAVIVACSLAQQRSLPDTVSS